MATQTQIIDKILEVTGINISIEQLESDDYDEDVNTIINSVLNQRLLDAACRVAREWWVFLHVLFPNDPEYFNVAGIDIKEFVSYFKNEVK